MSPAIGEMQLLGSGCCGRNECGERFRCGPLLGWPHFLPRRPAQPQGPYTSRALLSGYLLWSYLSSGPPVYRSRNRFWYQTVSFCSIISFLVLRCLDMMMSLWALTTRERARAESDLYSP